MPSGKERLYIGLHARAGKAKMPSLEDKYHWSLIIGPNNLDEPDASATCFDVREKLSSVDGELKATWQFEEAKISMSPERMLLVRIAVAEVADRSCLESILRSTPIRGGEQGWNCVAWAREALDLLQRDREALGTARIDWTVVRCAALEYVERKSKEHRFDGKGDFEESKVATWDLIEDNERMR